MIILKKIGDANTPSGSIASIQNYPTNSSQEVKKELWKVLINSSNLDLTKDEKHNTVQSLERDKSST